MLSVYMFQVNKMYHKFNFFPIQFPTLNKDIFFFAYRRLFC